MKLKSFFVSLAFLSLSVSGFTQAAWEHDFLKNINHPNPSSDVWKTLSTTTKPIAVGLPLGMYAVALIRKDKEKQIDAFEIMGALVINTITAQGMKAIVKRPRPWQTYSDIYPDEIDDSYSFPSGHVSTAFSTATSLSLTAKKWYVTVPAFVWASSVGYSRMYLGQHYPSDVLAGALVGIGSGYASHWLNQKFFFRRKTVKPVP